MYNPTTFSNYKDMEDNAAEDTLVFFVHDNEAPMAASRSKDSFIATSADDSYSTVDETSFPADDAFGQPIEAAAQSKSS